MGACKVFADSSSDRCSSSFPHCGPMSPGAARDEGSHDRGHREDGPEAILPLSSWPTADLWSDFVQKGFNRMSTLLVTGSSGLIGSEVVDYFCQRGWEVHGIDNNMRAYFFGPQGDTRGNQQRLVSAHARFHHHEVDIRDRKAIHSACRPHGDGSGHERKRAVAGSPV